MEAAARGEVLRGIRQRAAAADPRPRFAMLVLLLLSALAYVNTTFHPFVYDDLGLVLKNPRIRSLSNLPALVGVGVEGPGLRARWTRDVAYALEYSLAGPSPPLYHVTNILLHGCAGILIFLLVLRLARNPALGFWTAALFILHPIGTDVVAQISGRREILATLFSLAVLLAFAPRPRGGAWLRYSAAFFALYLGVFSKEMAIMAPLLVPFLDLYTFSAGGSGAALSWVRSMGRPAHELLRRNWRLYSLLAAAMLVVGCARLFLAEGGADLHGSAGFYETRLGGLTILERLRLMGLGVRLLLLPLGLSPDYSYDALGFAARTSSPIALVDLALFALALTATVLGLRRRSWIGLGGIWYFLFYLPTSGILPWHEIFAERFLYLPSIGFELALASGLVALERRSRALGRASGILLLCVLATATVLRNETWSTPERLWEDAVARYPSCARAHKALADQYLAGGGAREALDHYRAAVEILPPYRDARVGIGASLAALGRPAEAASEYEEVLRLWPEEAKALNDLGLLYEVQGRSDEALQLFRRAVRSDPDLPEPYNNMGRIYAETGQLDLALRMFEMAIERDPALVVALRNLAAIYRYGRHDESAAKRYDDRVRDLLPAR